MNDREKFIAAFSVILYVSEDEPINNDAMLLIANELRHRYNLRHIDIEEFRQLLTDTTSNFIQLLDDFNDMKHMCELELKYGQS